MGVAGDALSVTWSLRLETIIVLVYSHSISSPKSHTMHATDVIFTKFQISDKINVLNKQWITICFDFTNKIKGDVKI